MAKEKIKGTYQDKYYFFDETIEDEMIEELKLESAMEKALKNNEFQIVYQPKIDTKKEKVVGAEALVRWNKDGIVLLPNKFVPLFEKNKFIVKLDLYIFDKVCKDMATWQKKYGFTPVVSVNVSKKHFANENFIDEYVDITKKYGIDNKKIDLEITGDILLEDANINLVKIIKNIKKKNFIVSLDNFGSSTSSLNILQNIPIDILKIDKSFIANANLKSQKNLINYIVYIAKNLKIKTIIQGVETKEQVNFVKKLECDVIQGYYYSKPLNIADFEKYFTKTKKY